MLKPISQCPDAQCHQMARCETFSYGDAVYSGPNCLLSETEGAEISVSSDLVSDIGCTASGAAPSSVSRQGAETTQIQVSIIYIQVRTLPFSQL